MSIDARELRVGNLVTKNWVEYVVNYLIISKANEYDPIPLSEYIFSRCNLLPNGVFKDIEYFSILQDGSIYFEDTYTAVDLKYLHQLQNLYFELTGYELEVKI